MAKIQDPTATFMMLCIRDFTNKLWIPTKFVRKYSEISEKKSVMLKTDSDRFWDVKIKRINEDLYMEEGWSEFVKDNKLTAFDFLTFRLLRLHGSTDFKVSVYGADGCPKRPAAAASSSSISDDDDDDDDEDEDEDEDEEEEDDDDEDDDDDEHEIKARYDNVKKRRVLSRPRGRPPKIVLRRTNVSMKRGQSKAQHDVVCVGSSNNIGSSSNNNPLYMEITLKHIQRSRLILPARFSKACGLIDRKYVKMEFIASGYCKYVALNHPPYRIDLAAGWSDFRKATGIVVGKTYSFKYNPTKNVIRVKEVKKQN